MSSENPSAGGRLPDFLPPAGQEPVFVFAYEKHLEESATALPPEQEGAYRAAIVAECPTTNEEWEANGIRAGYAQDAYQSILLGTIANGARDTEVTASMLSRLGEQNDVLGERIPSELAQIIITRTLNTASAHPEATAHIIEWACTFIADEAAKTDAMSKALHHRNPDQLASLLPTLELIGRTELNEQALRTIRAHDERAAEQAEAQRAADEARAAKAARLQALEDRRNYIRNNAVQALAEIAGAYGVTIEDVASSELLGADELLFAATAVADQKASRSGVIDEASIPEVALATSILDRAIELRRSGVVFSTDRDSLSQYFDYALNKHEDRAVTAASSVDEFWGRLAKLAEWREMPPRHVSELYKEWRRAFIGRRQQELAASVLAQHDIDPAAELRPEGIDDLAVTVRHGTIVYPSIEEIISDMHTYFVPRMYRFEAGAVAADAVENAVGSVPASVMLSALNPDGDGGIMKRLEAEIRSWAEQEDSPQYRDSYDTGGGDPYKYSGGLFTGHGISITREKGQFLLNLQGRGYSYNSRRPTQQIDDFAAFVGAKFVDRVVTYNGDIQLVYRAEPPKEFAKSTRQRTISGEVTTEDTMAVSLPVAAALRQVQELLHISDESVEELWKIIESDPHGLEIPGILDGTIVVGVSPHQHLPIDAHRSADGSQLEGFTTIHNEERDDRRYFFLPELGLHVQSTNPEQHAVLAKLFHALGTMARHSARKNYDHGYVGGYSSFKPYAEI